MLDLGLLIIAAAAGVTAGVICCVNMGATRQTIIAAILLVYGFGILFYVWLN